MREEIRGIIEEKVRPRLGDNIIFTDDCLLFEELGLDSLDVMEIIMNAEGKLGKKIPDENLSGIRTVGDILNLFEKC